MTPAVLTGAGSAMPATYDQDAIWDGFFAQHYVANYCPLAFLEQSGRNRTPDKLAARERGPLFACCDRHLRRLVEIFRPEWVVGIGAFA